MYMYVCGGVPGISFQILYWFGTKAPSAMPKNYSWFSRQLTNDIEYNDRWRYMKNRYRRVANTIGFQEVAFLPSASLRIKIWLSK